MYSINLPQFEAYLLVTKEIFFKLVDRLSMDFLIIKVPQGELTHFFVEKYYYHYEYLGFCIYEN